MGNQHAINITDKYSKLTRTVTSARNITTTVACIFLDECIIPYGVPSYVSTDKSTQLFSKLIDTSCLNYSTMHMTTTAYHPNINGHKELYNNTILPHLRHYIATRQRYCNLFVRPLTYAYNTQVHRSTSTKPFSLVITRHPSRPTIFHSSSAPATHPQCLRTQVLAHIKELQTLENKDLDSAQEQYERYYNTKAQSIQTFKHGHMLYIEKPPLPASFANNPKKLDTTSYNKLLPNLKGPFAVFSIQPNTRAIEKLNILHTLSINSTTIALSNKPPTNAFYANS